MKIRSAAWIMLIIFSDSGIVKNGGDYESQTKCVQAWDGIKQCFAKLANKDEGKKCVLLCGQPIGFCIEGERLLAPGVIFPLNKDDDKPCGD